MEENQYNLHEQVEVQPPAFHCDKDISDFILYLNSFFGVHTVFSCQGDKDEDYEKLIDSADGYSQPYIMFLCYDIHFVKLVQAVVMNMKGVQFLSEVFDAVCIRHVLYFDSIVVRDEFIKNFYDAVSSWEEDR